MCFAVWFGYAIHRVITVRKPNAYAMQSAGQLILDHMRLHSGRWPGSWAELQDTCDATGHHILATNAEGEIEELKRRVVIDWAADPASMARLARQGGPVALSVIKLRSGARDSFVGAEPNEMIWEYLRGNTERGGAANGSQPIPSETNSTSSAAGSGRCR
jgi:hypothetical protein